MMRSRRSRWLSEIGAVVLSGGVLMASAGLGVTVAALLWFVDPAGAVPLESWDDKIPHATQRFKVLSEFNGAAVLDKETQLVWEQSPATTLETWTNARGACIDKNVGGRKGWRLPSMNELASLVDPANSTLSLPTGHPFTNVQSTAYWSASTDEDFPTNAWFVFFGGGNVLSGVKAANLPLAWCVRGRMNADQY